MPSMGTVSFKPHQHWVLRANWSAGTAMLALVLLVSTINCDPNCNDFTEKACCTCKRVESILSYTKGIYSNNAKVQVVETITPTLEWRLE